MSGDGSKPLEGLLVVALAFAAAALALAWAGSAAGTVVAQWGMVAAYALVIGRLATQHAASLRPQRDGVRGSARSGGWLFLRTVSLRAALLATVTVRYLRFRRDVPEADGAADRSGPNDDVTTRRML